MGRATCQTCDWTAEGEAEAVDRAAERHTKAGHATATRAVGR